MIRKLSVVVVILGTTCFPGLGRAEDATVPIRDDSRLFKPDTIARAEQQIDEIRRTYGHRLFVETVKSAGPHEKKLFRFLWTRQVNRILEEQARQRADAVGGNGIFVVICNDPRDVHVVVRPEDDPDFTRHDAENLRRTIARRLQEAGPDEGLLALPAQVRSILQVHASRGQSTSVVPELVLVGVLGGGVALWLGLVMLRYKMRRRQAEELGEEDVQEKSRRRPTLLSAMFGTPAGLWLYDKLCPVPARAADRPSAASIPVRVDPPGTDAEANDSPPAEERIADEPVSP